MSGIHSQSSVLLQRAWVISPALHSVAHTACLQAGSTPLLLLSHGSLPTVLASLKHWGLLLQLRCTFTNSPSWLSSSTSLHDPFSLGLHLHRWLFLASHSAKPQLFFMIPSCIQNQQHLGDSYTTKFSCQLKVQPRLPLEHSGYVLTMRTHFPEGFISVPLASSSSLFILEHPLAVQSKVLL